MDGKDKKEKVPSLQTVVYTGPSKYRPAELLQETLMQKSEQISQPEKMVEQT